MAGVLGQTVAAPSVYTPAILERIERVSPTGHVGYGWDVWHCYELSWCIRGAVGSWVGVLGIPADSPATVESKSLKLYLNSLNHHDFDSDLHAIAVIKEGCVTVCGRDSRLELTARNGREWDYRRTNGVEFTGLPFGGRSGDNRPRTLIDFTKEGEGRV